MQTLIGYNLYEKIYLMGFFLFVIPRAVTFNKGLKIYYPNIYNVPTFSIIKG